MSDLPAITSLYAREVEGGTATFETTPPDIDEMTRRFNAVKRLALPWLVAEMDSGFAGYAYAAPFRPRPAYRYCVEVSIYVGDGARRRGVGQALLEALIAETRVMKLRHLISAISDSDTSVASIALHGALGFQPAGVYRQVGWKFERWLDVTLMQLDLTPHGDPPKGPGLDLGGGLA
jgi:phosphinothricin acetyltransferase